MHVDEMDQDNRNPSAKRRKLADYFQKVPNNSEPQKFPGFLRRFQPTDMPRRQKCPVGRPRLSSVEPFNTETSTLSPHNVNRVCQEVCIACSAFSRSWRSCTTHDSKAPVVTLLIIRHFCVSVVILPFYL